MKTISLFIAGGVGKRLWPKSSNSCPKQFSTFFDPNKTLIEESIDRVLFASPKEDIYIVTDNKFKRIIEQIDLGVSSKNILYEPFGKNTSPAINYALSVIRQKYKEDAVIIVLPCDHFIGENHLFEKSINDAVEFAKKTDSIVTIGIKPRNPNTNYGYIKQGTAVSGYVFKVESFKEKPCLELATQYCSSGEYLWNSGIFIFKASVMAKAFEEHAQKQNLLFNKLFEKNQNICDKDLNDLYNQLDSISIDKGIIEKCDNLFVVNGSFSWDDLGSWISIEKHYSKDKNGNIVLNNDCILKDCDNVSSFSYDSKIIVACGLSNILIVNTKDKILIISKDKIKDISEIADMVDQRGE